jgi:hypothetical protein
MAARETLRREALQEAVDYTVAMYKRKQSLEVYFGMIDPSMEGSTVRMEALDFINTKLNPIKLGMKPNDVKKSIDSAIGGGQL